MIKILRKNWGLIFVLIFSWWVIRPLFHAGFFSMHDDAQVVRVYEMAQALKNGQFPVRWVGDLGYGYGYPLFNFYAPLPYYAGAFFNLVDLDILLATKIMFFLGTILSGVFMYLLAREFLGRLGGILASLLYLYAPYHAVDIYVRGAVGEFWAMAFLPLMALGFYKVFKSSLRQESPHGKELRIKNQESRIKIKISKEAWKWIAVGAIGYAGVILSHNLTAMMLTPFLLITLILFIYLAIKQKKLSIILDLLFIILLALGFSAFYWLPALFEMKFTNVVSQIGGGADFRDHFVCFSQFWHSPWGFGGSAPGCIADGMSFQIGKLQLMLIPAVLLLLFSALLKKRRLNDMYHLSGRNAVVLLTFIAFLLSVFLSTEYSKPIWEMVKPMAYIQYPWRFLVFATFFISLLAASVLAFFRNRLLRLIICVMLVAMLLPYRAKYFKPQEYLNLKAEDYISEENIKWKTSKISDEFLPKGFPKPQKPDGIAKDKIVALDKFSKISNLEIKSSRLRFQIEGENENLVLARVAYFPGWKVFVDGREKFFLVQNGQMFFTTPKGKHQVEVIFQNTLIRTIGNMASLVSLIVLLGGVFYGRKAKN